MTVEEQVQVAKDVLYEEHEVGRELAAYLVRIESAKENFRRLTDALCVFQGSLHLGSSITEQEGDRYRAFLSVSLPDLEKSCVAARKLSARLQMIREHKKTLGLA
jgi:hypothetical protein